MTRFNIQWTAKTLTNQMNKGKVKWRFITVNTLCQGEKWH